MKGLLKISFVIVLLFVFAASADAQCAICTKTASQLGEGPAKALNSGILYLMSIPLSLIFFIGYRWYKKDKQFRKEENS